MKAGPSRRCIAASLAAAFDLATLSHWAAASEGVLARCGASEGRGYFFQDPVFHPEPSTWMDDRIGAGKIILVRLGQEWDIQFDDAAGAHGYRQDGAEVMLLGASEGKITVGAFRGTYTDIYTFDAGTSEVVWSSHKIGTLVKKVAIYRADCSFIADW